MSLDYRNDIIAYIKEQLTDKYGANVIDVIVAYNINHSPTKSEIAVQIIDDSEDRRTTTFAQGETLSNVSFQVFCYGVQSVLNTVKRSAQENSIILAEEIKNMFAKNTITASNSNIKTVRRTATAPTMPIGNGSKVYVTSVRFESSVAKPYTKIY